MRDDQAAGRNAAESYLTRCADELLGGDRAAVLADRLSTLARNIDVVCEACREPLFGDAQALRDGTNG